MLEALKLATFFLALVIYLAGVRAVALRCPAIVALKRAAKDLRAAEAKRQAEGRS